MKYLSSDILYYRGLTGLIVAPVLFFIFIQMFLVNNFSNLAVKIIYGVLTLFILIQWYKTLKTRKVILDAQDLILETYFTKKSVKVSFNEVVNIRKVFRLSSRPTMYYKMTYKKDEKENSIYFFKAFEFYNVDDLMGYLGIER